MKNLILILSILTLVTSCIPNSKENPCYESKLAFGDSYVCGKISVLNFRTQMGIIEVSNTHDDSYKVFYDDESFTEQEMNLKAFDLICFQVENIRGIPFAKSITTKEDLEDGQLYAGRFSTSFSVHRELDHDYQGGVHKKTHIYQRTEPSGEIVYYAFKDASDRFNSKVELKDMQRVIIPSIYLADIRASSNRVFFADWLTSANVNGIKATPLHNISKCHSHGGTIEVCVQE